MAMSGLVSSMFSGIVPESLALAMRDFQSFSSLSCLNHHTNDYNARS